MSGGNKAICWSISALTAVIATGAASLAIAQGQPQYEVLPVHQTFLEAERQFEKEMTPEERKAISDARLMVQGLQLEVDKLLRGSSELSLDDDATKGKLDTWYGQYYFARLTHPEHLSEWPEKRQRFLQSLQPINVPADVHDYVVNFVMRLMLRIAQGNYHPVARYNAMLLIGMLNKTEADLIREKRLPVPSIQCLGTMMNEYADANQIDAVRVAALVGILRHAKIDRQLPEANRRLVKGPGPTRLVDLMVDLVNTKDAPQGRSQEGHNWMRRRAVDILGALGNVGVNNKVVSALEAVLDDDQAPVSLRCSATEALGQLNYPANATVNAAEIAKKMGAVAAHACHEEIQRVENQQKREQEEREASGGALGVAMPSSPMGLPFGGFGATSENQFDPLAYRIHLTRRRIKYQASLVKKGLVGKEKEAPPPKIGINKSKPGTSDEQPAEEKKSGILAVAKSPDDQQYVQSVASHVDAIMLKVDDTSFKDLTSLVTEIGTLVRSLEQDCGIVVSVDEMKAEAEAAEGLLENPLDNLGQGLGGIPSAKPSSKPAPAPARKTPAAPGTKTPTAPAAKTPTSPAAKTPAAPATKPPSKTPAAPPAGKTAPPAKTPVTPPKKTPPARQP